MRALGDEAIEEIRAVIAEMDQAVRTAESELPAATAARAALAESVARWRDMLRAALIPPAPPREP